MNLAALFGFSQILGIHTHTHTRLKRGNLVLVYSYYLKTTTVIPWYYSAQTTSFVRRDGSAIYVNKDDRTLENMVPTLNALMCVVSYTLYGTSITLRDLRNSLYDLGLRVRWDMLFTSSSLPRLSERQRVVFYNVLFLFFFFFFFFFLFIFLLCFMEKMRGARIPIVNKQIDRELRVIHREVDCCKGCCYFIRTTATVVDPLFFYKQTSRCGWDVKVSS